MKPKFIVVGLLLAFFSSMIIIESCQTPIPIEPPVDHLWRLPGDLEASASDTAFNIMAWETFIALNWPAVNSTAVPDSSRNIPSIDTNDYRTVWEGFKDTYNIYTKGPDTVNRIPSHCKISDDEKLRIHTQASKIGISNEFIQAATSEHKLKKAPLIDLDGKYVRYEVLYNDSMVGYVRKHKTYNRKHLTDFPDSTFNFPDGSLVIKAAWKVINEEDNPNDFFTAPSYMIYLHSETKKGVKVDTLDCDLAETALVGMHIAWKTPNHPNWLWMTFEHKDNAPDKDSLPTKKHFSFFNPDNHCTGCINQYPEVPKNPKTGKKMYDPKISGQTPSQIAREVSLSNSVKFTNNFFHDDPRIANTVWKNYNLVGIQWTNKVPAKDVKPIGIMPDSVLANTTIETWEQSYVGCMKCHNITAKNNLLRPKGWTKKPKIATDYVWSAFKALNDDPTEQTGNK